MWYETELKAAEQIIDLYVRSETISIKDTYF